MSEISAWKSVPEELTEELQRDASGGNQVLAYEKGRFYNAWLEFDPYEGGWIWMDDADSEPAPSHYMTLPDAPLASRPSHPEAEDGQ